MRDFIKTIEDMERLYYSPIGQGFLAGDDIKGVFLRKDAPVLTSTTGVYNAVYGHQAWVQLNMEANTLGYLPKIPHLRSGWRVITARSNTSPYGGTAENGSLPATTKPTFAEVSTKPKISAVNFDVSEMQEFLATDGGDDAYANMHQMRVYMASEHKEDLNVQLNTENGTLASNNFESVDRMVGSYTEVSTYTQAANGAYTAGDVDPYASASFDRDGSASWADAYVSGATSDRALTDALIQGVLQNTLTNGANPNGQLWQTGYDTWSSINQLYETQVRYNLIGSTQIQPGVNGIKTQEGSNVGMKVATLLNNPVIQSKNTVQETSGISRLYLLDISNPEGFDMPRMSLRIAKPTQYFEAGINKGDPFGVNRFGDEGMFRTMGELICTFFAVQGKVRDLSG